MGNKSVFKVWEPLDSVHMAKLEKNKSVFLFLFFFGEVNNAPFDHYVLLSLLHWALKLHWDKFKNKEK